jgi:hypothetical protein
LSSRLTAIRGPTRVLSAIAATAAAAVLLLGAATSLVLRSDWLLRKINADPETFFVSFTEPRVSLAPGRIRFATLTLRSSDSNVEWEARLDDVALDVDLRELAGRRLHVSTVRAAGLTFRLRERLTHDEATPARSGCYPRIVGYRDPPLREPPAPPAAPGNPWRVLVDDLRVELVRELWIDAWRWDGEGRLSGGLFLRPGIQAEVLPSGLDVKSGTLRWGTHVISRETAGRVQASLPRFDTQAFPGNEVWKIISGAASIVGTLDGLAFLAPEGGGPRLAEGSAGSVRLRAGLRDGQGSARLDATASALVDSFGSGTVRGAVTLHAFAPRIDFPKGSVAFEGTHVRIRSASIVGAAGPPWNGLLEAREAKLHLADGALDARLLARLGDARPVVALLPSGPPKWIAGLLDLHDFEASGRLRASSGFLALSPAHAQAGTFSIDADWRRRGLRRWGALLVRKGAVSLGLGLGSGAASVHLAGGARWFEGEGRPGGLRTDQSRASGGVERPISHAAGKAAPSLPERREEEGP